MGFLDSLKALLRGQSSTQGSGGGRSSFGSEAGVYWVHAQCRRCGEPLRSRVNLHNDPSLAEDGEGWVVRKGLIGSGKNLCFQTVEVTLYFNPKKTEVISGEATGGKLISAEEYEALMRDA